MASSSLRAFQERITVDVRGLIAEDARRLLIETARAGHQQTLQRQQARGGGVSPTSRQIVNGIEGQPLEAAELPNPITFIYDYRREVAIEALKAVIRNSANRSGAYRRSHFIMVNGAEVQELGNLAPGDEIVVTNDRPYTRRLEIGLKRDGSPFVAQMEYRMYEQTAERLAQRYRNVARVTFNYIDLKNPYRLKGSQRKRRFLRNREGRLTRIVTSASIPADRRAGEPIRYPAIIIRSL